MYYEKILTGFNLIDNLWQGFYRGRTYLITGPINSGKTTFCLQFAYKGLTKQERVIFFTDERPEDVILRAEALQFNIYPYLESGNFLIFNLDSQKGTFAQSDLFQRITDELIQIIKQEKPTRLIIDPISFLIQLAAPDTMKQNISQLINSLEASKATVVATIGEPANNQAVQILDFLNTIVTASIRLNQNLPDKTRTVSLQSRIGHFPDLYFGFFIIQSGIGLTQLEATTPSGEAPVTAPKVEPAAKLVETEPTPTTIKIIESVAEKPPAALETSSIQGAKPDESVTAKPLEIAETETEKTGSEKSLSAEELTQAPRVIPEYPIRDLDRDDFTGLYNFDGLLHIVNEAIERKDSFSLMLTTIIKGVDSRAKRLLLSPKLALAVKKVLAKPFPLGRYSDRIIVFLDKIAKLEAKTMLEDIKGKISQELIAENSSLEDVDIRIDVYGYPDDIRTIKDVEAIVERNFLQ